MAAIVDIKRQSRIVHDKNGYRVERIAIVSGVTGSLDALLKNAIEDGQLPAYGDPHPSITGITLNSISGSPIGGGLYRVVLSYFKDTGAAQGSANATVRASATTAVEEVGVDAAGNAMTTTFSHANSTYEPRFVAEVEKPRVSFDFEWTEAAFPQSTIDTYLGKINSAVWNGYAAKTILCTGINVTQSGDEYRVRMSLTHNPETWVFVAKIKPYYSTATTTDPSLDMTTGTKKFDVYPAVDFTPLGLTL